MEAVNLLLAVTPGVHVGGLRLWKKRRLGKIDLRWSLHAFFRDTSLIQHCAIQKHHRKPEGLVLGCFFCVLGGWGGWGGCADIKNIVPPVGEGFLWRASSGFLGFWVGLAGGVTCARGWIFWVDSAGEGVAWGLGVAWFWAAAMPMVQWGRGAGVWFGRGGMGGWFVVGFARGVRFCGGLPRWGC